MHSIAHDFDAYGFVISFYYGKYKWITVGFCPKIGKEVLSLEFIHESHDMSLKI